MTTAVAPEIKKYTSKDIDAFTDQELETFAANLSWRDRTSYYGTNTRLKQYRRTGHPRRYGNNNNVTSRQQFLRLRLKQSRQETWNPAIKELKELEAKKARESWSTAPKVKMKVTTTVETLLSDCRVGGYTFKFWKDSSGKFRAQQVQGAEGNLTRSKQRVGRSVCATNGIYEVEEILDALALLEEVEMPSAPKLTKGKAKITVEAYLKVGANTSHPLVFGLVKKGVVGVKQYDRYDVNNNWSWHFNIVDMREALGTFNKKYKVVEVKEEVTE